MRNRHTLCHRILLACLLLGLSACRSSHTGTDYHALAKAAIRLGVDIDRDDNHSLYLNAAQWIGTPYRKGGCDKQGIDCSGLTRQLYKDTYRIRLPRSVRQQQYEIARILTQDELCEGDLVFFNSHPSRKKATHVGVYLKDWKFIHAGSRGVVVSSLLETYYKEHWICGGRVK